MSSSYLFLCWKTSLSPQKALAIFNDYFRDKNRCSLIETGVEASAGTVHIVAQEMIKDSFGFVPSVNLSFAIDKDSDIEELMRPLVFTSIEFLEFKGGDAVMWPDADGAFYTKTDKWRLNSLSSFWSKENLARVTVCYVQEPLIGV